uniref:Uncharacterized protein n=1 Tax=Lepeophtheirus salmonis TaxID=72036 RepID=A0A0K2V750_LEPSM
MFYYYNVLIVVSSISSPCYILIIPVSVLVLDFTPANPSKTVSISYLSPPPSVI